MNPLWARIHRLLCCANTPVILDHWSWSRSLQKKKAFFKVLFLSGMEVFCQTQNEDLENSGESCESFVMSQDSRSEPSYLGIAFTQSDSWTIVRSTSQVKVCDIHWITSLDLSLHQLAKRARGVVHVMLNGTRQHFMDRQIFPSFMDDRLGNVDCKKVKSLKRNLANTLYSALPMMIAYFLERICQLAIATRKLFTCILKIHIERADRVKSISRIPVSS